MGWPKGKARKRVEPSSEDAGIDSAFVRGNRLAKEGAAARHAVADSIVNPMLRLIEEKLGNDAMRRGAPALNKLVRALVEKAPLPGQKPKPMVPLPEHVYKAQHAAKTSPGPVRIQTGALS